MWKIALICSCLAGCADWEKNPDGAVEQFVEQALETAIEKGAGLVGVEADVEIDFTPENENQEPPARLEESPFL